MKMKPYLEQGSYVYVGEKAEIKPHTYQVKSIDFDEMGTMIA